MKVRKETQKSDAEKATAGSLLQGMFKGAMSLHVAREHSPVSIHTWKILLAPVVLSYDMWLCRTDSAFELHCQFFLIYWVHKMISLSIF